MIKANELRIGNWVDGEKAGLIRIEKISPESADAARQKYDIIFSDLNSKRESLLLFEEIFPIPLTPEILEKCGFEKMKIRDGKTPSENNIYDKNKLRVAVDIHTVFLINNSNNGEYIGSILYLHQLQNLYFALAGEELQVDL